MLRITRLACALSLLYECFLGLVGGQLDHGSSSLTHPSANSRDRIRCAASCSSCVRAYEARYDPKNSNRTDGSENTDESAKSIVPTKETEDAILILFALHGFSREDLLGDDRISDDWDLTPNKDTLDAISLGGRDHSRHTPRRLSTLMMMRPGGRFLVACETEASICTLRGG